MTFDASGLQMCGAFCFGTILGWFLYYINRYRTGDVKIGDLASVVSTLGGGAILTLFEEGTDLFGAYGIGLFVGFFGYFLTLLFFVHKSDKFDLNWFLDGKVKGAGPDDPAVGGRGMGNLDRTDD